MRIVLCGSARFEEYFHLWNEVLTLSGHTIHGLSVYPSTKNGKKDWYSDEEKRELDKAHFRKIDASDGIFVLNVCAYIGDSTLKEIEYARANGKVLIALESWGKGCGITEGGYSNEWIGLAMKYKCLGAQSPIDTCFPDFKAYYDFLYPEAGRYRSGLVDKLNEQRKKEGLGKK